MDDSDEWNVRLFGVNISYNLPERSERRVRLFGFDLSDNRPSEPEVQGPAFRVNPLVPRNQYVYQVHDLVSHEPTDQVVGPNYDRTVFSHEPISQQTIDMMRELNSLMAEMGHMNLMDPGESFRIRRLGEYPPRILLDLNEPYDDTSDSSTYDATSFAPSVESQPPPPAHPIMCAICMGTMVEATTTICGHVFCGGCIRTITANGPYCPICQCNITPP